MIDRRVLLKGLAAATLGSGAANLNAWVPTLANNGQATLNLVLHGLFVMQFTKDNIQLITPYVSQHRYLVSGWDPWDLNPLCPENQPFILTGVTKLHTYDPTRLKRGLVLSMARQNFHIDNEHAYLTITLPWPQDIVLLRFAKPEKPDPKTGKSNIFKSSPLDNVTELSLCQALVYPVNDPKSLGLMGKRWSANAGKLDPQYNTVNMHLWAEPDHRTMPSHAQEAYNQLGTLLPKLDFTLVGADVTANRDEVTGVNGLPVEQEMGLSEWLKRGEGSAGSNCGVVMVVD